MSRQLVAFLSLFSLVLVLSIYYITMPFTTSSPTKEVGNTIVESASNIYFDSIALEKEKEHNDKISEYETYLASSEVSGEEKEVYLSLINEEKKMMANEILLEESIMNLGYPYCYVKLLKDSANVITYKKDYTQEDVIKIIDYVTDILQKNIQVYVEFHS